MKKSLVLAMAMALGVTASAYAANPFSDVPAGHWAYDSISKLAAAGVIEGYGDDTFRGDRLMTRYEMAQIVAKEMAKGANVDKLAAEFADELDALGVRVAALEKKSDNVKITGEFRWHYANLKDMAVSAPSAAANSYEHKIRSRIWFTGQVNDNWKYVGMLENVHDITKNAADEETKFQRAYLQGRLGGAKIMAGRYHKVLYDAMIYGTRMDGIDISYGDKVKLNAYYGKPTNSTGKSVGEKPDKMFGIGLKADLSKTIGLHAGWDKFKGDDHDASMINAGLDFKFGKDVKVDATYLHANADGAAKNASENGFVIGVNYKGAQKTKPGTWGLGLKYYQAPGGISEKIGWDTGTAVDPFIEHGFKGWYAAAYVTVAKNMVAGVEYWDMKSREHHGDKAKTLWTELKVSF